MFCKRRLAVHIQEKALDVKELVAQKTQAGAHGKPVKSYTSRISHRGRTIRNMVGMINAWHRLRPEPLPSINRDGTPRVPRVGDDLFTEEQVLAMASDGEMPEGVLGGLYGRMQDLRLGKEYFMASSNHARCQEEEGLLVKEVARLKAWIENMDARCCQVWAEQRGSLAIRDAANIAHVSDVVGSQPEAEELWATRLARWNAGVITAVEKPGPHTLLVYKYRRALANMRVDFAPRQRRRRRLGQRR
jgi:hypothetical protein